MRKNAHDTNYEVRIEIPPGLEWLKNQNVYVFFIEMVRFGEFSAKYGFWMLQ